MGPDDLRLTREYLEEGWTTRELQRARETGEVLRLRRGVYAALDGRDVEAQHRARAAAASLLRIPGTAISHQEAGNSTPAAYVPRRTVTGVPIPTRNQA